MTSDDSTININLKKKQNNKSRKILNPETKELILSVVNFMKKEACGEFCIPAKKVQYRAAVATGFSERTIRRIVKEAKTLLALDSQKETGMCVSFPTKKKPHRLKPKTGLDKLTLSTVRKIIHGIYVNDKKVPTIKKVHQKLVKEINFRGSSRSAHKIIKDLGFFWKKTTSKRFILLEKHEIRVKRIEYLRNVNNYRREHKSIIYVGHITVHNPKSCFKQAQILEKKLVIMLAGGQDSLLLNTLEVFEIENMDGNYHQKLSNLYQDWIRNTLLHNFHNNTVLVLDCSVYFHFQPDKLPVPDSSIEEMKKWLDSKNITYINSMLKPELYKIIKQHSFKFQNQKCIVEKVLTDNGHIMLKLPPEHPDLNPVNLYLKNLKHFLSEDIKKSDAKDFKTLCQQTIQKLESESWFMSNEQVKKTEHQYLESEGIIDQSVEKLLIKN